MLSFWNFILFDAGLSFRSTNDNIVWNIFYVIHSLKSLQNSIFLPFVIYLFPPCFIVSFGAFHINIISLFLEFKKQTWHLFFLLPKFYVCFFFFYLLERISIANSYETPHHWYYFYFLLFFIQQLSFYLLLFLLFLRRSCTHVILIDFYFLNILQFKIFTNPFFLLISHINLTFA